MYICIYKYIYKTKVTFIFNVKGETSVQRPSDLLLIIQIWLASAEHGWVGFQFQPDGQPEAALLFFEPLVTSRQAAVPPTIIEWRRWCRENIIMMAVPSSSSIADFPEKSAGISRKIGCKLETSTNTRLAVNIWKVRVNQVYDIPLH